MIYFSSCSHRMMETEPKWSVLEEKKVSHSLAMAELKYFFKGPSQIYCKVVIYNYFVLALILCQICL